VDVADTCSTKSSTVSLVTRFQLLSGFTFPLKLHRSQLDSVQGKARVLEAEIATNNFSQGFEAE
jgi:hypothetical protein